MTTNYWFTADSHFGHNLIMELRGISPCEHDDMLIEAWNERVKPGDVVYHLGDFMLPQRQDRAEKILRKLNGTKHFCPGNHDTKQVERAKGWSSVKLIRDKKINGQPIVMSHYAMRTWNRVAYGAWNLYGHSHGQLQPIGKAMDVGVDCSPKFAPFNFDEIESIMGWQQVVTAEWHRSGREPLTNPPGRSIVNLSEKERTS